MFGFQMVQILNGGLKSRQKVSVLWYKMSSIQMVRLITWSDHLKTGQKSVQKFKCSDMNSCLHYSDGYCTWNIKFVAHKICCLISINFINFSSRPRNRKQQPKERQKLQKQKAPLPRLPRAVEERGRALEAAGAEPEAKSEKSSVIF